MGLQSAQSAAGRPLYRSLSSQNAWLLEAAHSAGVQLQPGPGGDLLLSHEGLLGHGETPGALTYSERIARSWCGGDKDRQLRAKTEAFERESMREAIRATSEVRREVTPQAEVDYSSINTVTQKAEEVLNTHRRMIREISEDTLRKVQEINPRYEDNISKKMADIRMSPWRGQELDTEYRTSQEARTRISGLERELDEITRKAMTYRRYGKTGAELAADAMRDDAQMSSFGRRTKRVTYESTRRPIY